MLRKIQASHMTKLKMVLTLTIYSCASLFLNLTFIICLRLLSHDKMSLKYLEGFACEVGFMKLILGGEGTLFTNIYM